MKKKGGVDYSGPSFGKHETRSFNILPHATTIYNSSDLPYLRVCKHRHHEQTFYSLQPPINAATHAGISSKAGISNFANKARV